MNNFFYTRYWSNKLYTISGMI